MRILILALFCPLLLVGQGKVDADAFFSIGMAQAQVLASESEKKVTFPWIEKYDLRTETRDMDPAQQEYTLRLSPTSPGRRKALKGAYNHLAEKPDFEGEEVACERRMEVHLDWLTLFVLHQQLVELQAYQDVLTDKQAVMEKLVGTYEFDVKKLLTLEMDKNDLSIDIYNLQQQADRIAGRYSLRFSDLNFEGFIDVDMISKTFSGLQLSQMKEDPELMYKRTQVQRELALERSENRQYLDFVQVKYRGPHTDLLNERVSIGLGINIANPGDRKLKIQELTFEQDQIEREVNYKQAEQGQRLSQLAEKLNSDLASLAFQKKISEREQERLKSISDLISQKEGFDPLLLLDMKERRIQVRLSMLQKLENIYVVYLKYLDVTGRMCEEDRIFLRS